MDQLKWSPLLTEAVNVSEGIRLLNEFNSDIANTSIRVAGESGFCVLELGANLGFDSYGDTSEN